MATSRDDFSEKTKRLLADRVNWICSFPGCNQSTLGPSNVNLDQRINNGVAAHICAAAENGPRYDPNMSEEERKHSDNGIWMCRNHGNLIDADFDNFTVDILRQWKVNAEKRAYERLSTPNGSDNAPKYTSQDRRALDLFNSIFPYDTLKIIGEEPFGKFVSDEVIHPFNELLYHKDDPFYSFNNAELEALRHKLLDEAWLFIRHFSQQSAGAVGGYVYINIPEFRRYNPEIDEEYWIQYSERTVELAANFCQTAFKIRAAQKEM